jgi:hypothetical protein
MARRLRFPLLLLLAALTVSYVISPTPAGASPACSNTTGHFYETTPQYGLQSSTCGPIVYCQLGTQTCEWDCAYDPNGNIVPKNIVCHSPNWCQCTSYAMRCC